MAIFTPLKKIIVGRKRKPAIENLEIVDIAAEGKAIGRYNDMVVFVPQVIPGDVVNVQVNKMRKSYMEAFVTQLVKPSPLRTKPICDHFGVCGGCKWQHLPYELQLKYKHKQVVDQLRVKRREAETQEVARGAAVALVASTPTPPTLR